MGERRGEVPIRCVALCMDELCADVVVTLSFLLGDLCSKVPVMAGE